MCVLTCAYVGLYVYIGVGHSNVTECCCDENRKTGGNYKRRNLGRKGREKNKGRGKGEWKIEREAEEKKTERLLQWENKKNKKKTERTASEIRVQGGRKG